ncbi:YkvA family protein [Chryseobacterium taklimakanense]|uniref:YkvA family protein n=1 Tax=Chryseobacterium taklimakanense TaxID=536441 RepID=UPI0023F8D813|nr:DUF1232 domain-containing protein [Chryseobacterium taklimakanense]
MAEFLKKIKSIVKELKKETLVLAHAVADKRTPVLAKIFAAMTVAYLLSPIDLIPDFIPVFGLLDDIILVPVLIKITVSLIPESLLDELRTRVDSDKKLQKKWYYALPVIVIYLLLIFLLYKKISFK